jgi:hypothetical protein
MSDQITLTLPTGFLQRAEVVARRAGRPVEELLSETLQLSLEPLVNGSDDRPPESWSNEEVLAAADGQMPAEEDERLSELLHRQQAGTLSERDRPDLTALMGLYQRRLLHKAQGWREAVRRGLRAPVQP